MIAWLETQISTGEISVSANLIRDLTEEEKADQITFYQAEKDFNYEVLPSDITKAFISSNKFKAQRPCQLHQAGHFQIIFQMHGHF